MEEVNLFLLELMRQHQASDYSIYLKTKQKPQKE